jgi:hypothetical protein
LNLIVKISKKKKKILRKKAKKEIRRNNNLKVKRVKFEKKYLKDKLLINL